MNKKRKIGVIYLIIFLFMITGCTPEYRLEINHKNEVTENVVITIDNELFETKNIDGELKSHISAYEKIGKYSIYDFDTKFHDNFSKVIINREYSNAEELRTSPLIKNLFEGFRYTSNSKFTEMSTSGDYNKEYLFGEGSKLNKFSVIIQLENKVISHNADFVNKTTNEYKWEFTKEMDSKTISIKYSDKLEYFVVFLNWLSSNKTLLIIFGGLIGIIGLLYLYAKFIYKYRNKI